MISREMAWRVFSAELNASSFTYKGDEEKSPSYLVTPLGARINRVIAAGVLTDKENVGSEDEPMWRARVNDPSGSFFVNAGRYQPEASAALADMATPSFVAVVGKVRTYSPDDGRVFVSIRPESIVEIDEATRDAWVLEACEGTLERMEAMRMAVSADMAATVDGLVSKGVRRPLASGIVRALDHYGLPDSGRYIRVLQQGLRFLLPDDDVDLGLTDDLGSFDSKEDERAPIDVDVEDSIMDLIDELDTDGRGAPISRLIDEAQAKGVSEVDFEEISNSLMDKGLIYEPVLGKLKRI